MPTLSELQHHPPKNWEQFEELCCDLWRRIWNDPTAQLYGRRGQRQLGVDVFGRPDEGEDWAGLQCKLKDRLSGAYLTKKAIAAEVKKARSFNPRLSGFTIATTAPRDVRTQDAAREITESQRAEGSFPVAVYSWDDICRELAKHRDLAAEHFPDLNLGGGRREEYLAALWSQLLPVPLLAVSGARRKDIPLSAVYTSLDTTAEASVSLAKNRAVTPSELGGISLQGDKAYLKRLEARLRPEAEAERESEGAQPHEDVYRRRLTALEAAAAVPRRVLIGPAGSGKSTFVRYLALSLVGEALGRDEADLRRLNGMARGEVPETPDSLAWPHGALLPIFVELRKFVRSDAFPEAGKRGDGGHLLSFLEEESCGPESGRYGELIREICAAGEALLILDGLDETPAAEQSRGRLMEVIKSWSHRYPKCRVLVTSRPYAYEEGSVWRLDDAGFVEASLAPFDQGKIRHYIELWYRHLAARGQIDERQAKRLSDLLVQEIESTSYLKPLAERPLMLSMMAELHASGGGYFKGGRAALYERSVELLLDRWNEVRDIEEGRSVADLLGMDLVQIRRALERLAYEVHRDQGLEEAEAPAAIRDETLWKALDRERSKEGLVDERRVMDFLHQRSGLLLAESPSRYRFPHRSYQEYLAACYLTANHFPELLEAETKSNPELWREVVLLAAGHVSSTPHTVWALLESLVATAPPAELAREDPRLQRALYAGLAIIENRLFERVEPKYKGKLEGIRQWLERSIELEALSPQDRAAGGRVLSLLGDRRAGVGLGEDGVPDIDWVEIPAGAFTMGSQENHPFRGPQQREVELPAFRISRYPVTNAQYRAFVDDGGYREKMAALLDRSGLGMEGREHTTEGRSPGGRVA